MTKTSLVEAVRAYTRGVLTLGEVNQELLDCERDDLQGQAAIRFLLNQGRWDFLAPSSDTAMQHLFGSFPGRITLAATDYVAQTKAIITENWGVTIEDPTPHVPEVRDTLETKTPKKTKGKSKDGGESGSRTFKSLAEHGQTET